MDIEAAGLQLKLVSPAVEASLPGLQLKDGLDGAVEAGKKAGSSARPEQKQRWMEGNSFR